MDFFNYMDLSSIDKVALDAGLFRMYILGPLLYYGFYRALMWLANHTIEKYTKEDR